MISVKYVDDPILAQTKKPNLFEKPLYFLLKKMFQLTLYMVVN